MSSCIIRDSVLGMILLAVRSIGKTLFVSEGSGAPSWYTKGVPCGVFALVGYSTIDENRLNRVAGNWHIWFDFRRYCCDPFGLKVGLASADVVEIQGDTVCVVAVQSGVVIGPVG